MATEADNALITAAGQRLSDLFESWKSRFCYTIDFDRLNKRTAHFVTTWSRFPTPHQPLPNIRIELLFAIKYRKVDTEYKHPEITFRMEQQEYVHRKLRNVDKLLVAMFKIKSQLFTSQPVTLENEAYYENRFEYSQVPEVESVSKDFVNPKKARPTGREIEQTLVTLFQKYDQDKDLLLSPTELDALLADFPQGTLALQLQLGSLILSSHDTNKDGYLSYSEFVPIGVDLLQVAQADQAALDAINKLNDDTLAAAGKRVESSRGLMNSIDVDLPELDPEATGTVPIDQMMDFLTSLDIELTDFECDQVIQLLEVSADGFFEFQKFQQNYKRILETAIQRNAIDQHSSETSEYLFDIFETANEGSSGLIRYDDVLSCLRQATDLNLSELQLMGCLVQADSFKTSPSPASEENEQNDNSVIMIRYEDFIRQVSILIDELSKTEQTEAKRMAILRAEVEPVELLAEASKAGIREQLRVKFSEFDSSYSGFLSKTDFHASINDTGLALSADRIEELRLQTVNEEGKIGFDEFLQFSYNFLLKEARENALEAKIQKADEALDNITLEKTPEA